MHTSRWLAAAAILTLAAACGGGGGQATAPPAGQQQSGPVTLEYWTDKLGAKGAVAAFNAAHQDVRLKFVEVPGVDLVKNLRNAHKAGDAATMPCLAQTDNRNGGQLLAEGVIKDLTKDVSAASAKFSPGAVEALTLAGVTYGVPDKRDPLFSMFHKPTFDKRGLTYPTTWEELIELGRKHLKKDGVAVFNLAGEDPSTLMGLSWQGGARWYTIQGDAWKINFTDDASKWAAGVMQQLLDDELVQKISYAEYAAMMQEYDQGKIAMRQVSTWQLAGHQKNMKNSLGDWEAGPNLIVKGRTSPVSAADTAALVVPSLCAHPEQAVAAALWLATESAPIKAMADPVSGNGWYPAVADAAPYIDATVPKQLWGEHAAAGAKVIAESGEFASDWVYGPNSTAMYEELADKWGKAMNGEMKVEAVLEHMQKWTVDDLRQKGVKVVE
ncbi:multiple sugar transport system substrate-binding protein [Nonomuraea muscovyensis]|uniref:Multiple sugar transport system substrate-binding protein n=1 Tax=Nonomuraea muscovyensis TaxID=1124761 RepID=A0A7X0F0L5_9ACTN|nr:extracellular solute-binding protein [Nonomuraea muscovyensis]MBB6351422.1 multiple sugar transport system substrate-binding protein [Nonomuraea muscovyensis]